MDFAWTSEQIAQSRAVEQFAAAELNDQILERDRNCEFGAEAWRRCAGFGIQGLPFPPEDGGGGCDILTTLLVMERLGYACRDNGLLFAINAHMWSAAMPIHLMGTAAQKKRFLAPMCRGDLISGNGSSEPDAGSDVFSMKTRATRRGDKYVLDGTKTFVTNAPVADALILYATVDPARGIGGLCAFIVEMDSPGLSLGRTMEKMGLRTSPMAEVILEGCEVPEENLLGSEGSGMAAFNCSMEWERASILATCVGTMERQLEQCIAHAGTRRQFDKPIGDFQSVSNRIAEMKVRLETSRLLLYRFGWLAQEKKKVHIEAAVAKLHISEAFVASSLDAVQIHGGYGYMAEFEQERMLRDAVASRIYSGTNDIQRNLIAGHLGL